MGKPKYALKLCMASVFLLISQLSSAAEVVVFPDPGLNAVVREAINKPTGDILDTDLVGFKFLYGAGRDISDLTGLEHCTDLTLLALSSNQIDDLTPAAGLTGLTHLELGSNQIGDLAALVGLTSLAGLTYLELGSNQISDLTPLASLSNLTELYLDVNQIVNVSPLASLTGLTRLSIYGNQIADVTPLAALSNLTFLNVADNEYSDISVLSDLTSLTVFAFGTPNVTDISVLSGLANLQTVLVGFTQVRDISVLAGLTNLINVDFSQNPISDFTPLAGLPNLLHLGADTCELSDLSTLAGLTHLTQLQLAGNQITDLTALAGLTSLQLLDMPHNQISDLTPLAGLTNLLLLNLQDNQIADLAPLVANTGLGASDSVNVTQNPLSQNALCEQIPRLQWRGVHVPHDGTCGSEGEGEGEGETCTLFQSLDAQGASVAANLGSSLGPLLELPEEYWTDYSRWDIEGIEEGLPGPFGDGIRDLWQLATFADGYCNPSRWLHDEAVAAYEANLAAVTSELPERSDIWEWIAASVSLSSRMRGTVCALFLLIPEHYVVVTLPAKSMNEPFSAEGDCDGDGTSNIEEYEYVVASGGDINAFVTAASENSPFWQGNPALPIAGSAGLLLLCAGITFAAIRFGSRSQR